jgi:hypothetical protein
MNITVGHCKCEPRNKYSNDEHYSRSLNVNHEISIVMMNITVGHYKCEPRNKYSNDEHYRRALVHIYSDRL